MTARRPAVTSSVAEELSAVLAPDVLERLLGELGGCEIYVPKTAPGEHHPISVAIGQPAAARLSEYFGGVVLDLPVGGNKRQTILELHAAGERRRSIARKVGLTERRVYQVLAERQAPAQPGLFT